MLKNTIGLDIQVVQKHCCLTVCSQWYLNISVVVRISSRPGPFCAELVCWCGLSQDTPASSRSRKRAVSGVGLVGDSKLLIGVNVSVSGCLSLCVCPATDCCGSYRHLDNSSNIVTVLVNDKLQIYLKLLKYLYLSTRTDSRT